MRPAPSRILRRTLGWLALGSIALVLLELGAIDRLREENHDLAAARLRRQNAASIAALRHTDDVAEIEKLRGANRDLLKLRNEVRQVRQLPAEIARLRAQIEQLKATRDNPGRVAAGIPPGFIAEWRLSGALE